MSETTPFWIAVTLINTMYILVSILKWLQINPPSWAIVIMVIIYLVGICSLIAGAILYLARHLRWVVK